MSHLEMQKQLADKLAKMRVRINVPDENTAIFHNVPTNDRYFSKGATNVLIKRTRQGMPFVVCVDESLDYVGADAAVSRAFVAGIKRDGWRALYLGDLLDAGFDSAVQDALAVIGFDGQEPAVAGKAGAPPGAAAQKEGLLAAYGRDLTQLVKDQQADETVGREDQITDVASCMLRRTEVRLAIISGESGVGKTNLLPAVAARLARKDQDLKLIAVDLALPMAGTLFEAERESRLAGLLNEASNLADAVLALEHIELVMPVPHGLLLLANFLDTGHSLIGTTWPAYVDGFQRRPIARRMQLVDLEELSPTQAAAVLERWRRPIASHHGIEIGLSCINQCVKAARPLAGCYPAKAIALLDAAAARASLTAVAALSPDDIYAAAANFDVD